MKLSDIVAYLNLLDSLSVKYECNESIRNLEAVLHIVVHRELQFDQYREDLQQSFDNIHANIKEFDSTLDRLRLHLQQEIERQAPEHLRESLRVFEHEMPFETNDYILNRQLACDPDSDVILRSKLRACADWRLPGMIIGPGRESFIEELVPLDPLYLVDQHQELLAPAVLQFSPEYQRRLRPYVVSDRQINPILGELPNSQFGFVFAYNYFNYRPIEIINRYLAEIVNKLRPGGTFIMTYNNCDRAHGVALSERHWMMYTPRHMIINYAEKVGLEHVDGQDGLGDLSWLEFRKPGKIESLRGGQTLAKIFAISE
jgi:SAM-dependent methyltransferase